MTLDINKLRRNRLIRPGFGWGGTLIWTETYSGRHIASVGYDGHLGTERGRLRLFYTTMEYDGTKHSSDYAIDLASTPQPFGGRRWWFVCPRTRKLVSKLYLPPGALTFASRHAYRLAYHSQRQTPRDRSLGRAFKARRRLGDHEGIGGYIVRPKGMRWRTFHRLIAKVETAEDVVEDHTALLLDQLMQKTKGRAP